MTNRRPKGTPTGGQFAPGARAEVGVDLGEQLRPHVLPDGTELWYRNGELHREDGPAVVWPNGYQVWCQNDQRHRKDGPAIVWPDGRQEWWQHGRRVDPPPSVPA